MMHLCFLNVRSITNKAMAVEDLVVDHDIDIIISNDRDLVESQQSR